MIHFFYGDKLLTRPELAHSMFKDRAEQFHRRLGWDVFVDRFGEERDEYDELNPLYVIVSDQNGLHEASMRLLPTVGQTMVHDHFLDLTDDVKIQSPVIWECTRFCVSPTARLNAATKLMAAGGKLMEEFFIEHFVGVFDRKMLAIYRRTGSSPTVVGWSEGDRARVGVGLWQFKSDEYFKLLSKCGLSQMEMELWFVNSGLLEKQSTLRSKMVA